MRVSGPSRASERWITSVPRSAAVGVTPSWARRLALAVNSVGAVKA